MSRITDTIPRLSDEERQRFIVTSFVENYGELMSNDPSAWRGKLRKMAKGAFDFYRGSVALYYADVSRDEDPFLDERTSRVWIQGDLHAANFGTYMNSAGLLIFDVNDFDEAYVAPFTWDLKRLVASFGLLGFDKALSDAEIREVIRRVVKAYVGQVTRFALEGKDDFSLNLSNTKGKLLEVLRAARRLTRVALLDLDTEIVDGDRQFRENPTSTRADDAMRAKVEASLEEYYKSLPDRKRRNRMTYRIKDVAQRRGMGIGSAGLPIYSLLLEGESQALENDLILSVKEAQAAAPSRYIDDARIKTFFRHDGHRTAVSQRALQSYADPMLGYTTIDGKGMLAAEVSPYVADLDWGEVNDVDEILEVGEYLGKCVAKIHCCSDIDSDHTLVTFSTEEAIHGVLSGREAEFVDELVRFGEGYAAVARNDHRLFVDAFRNHMFPGL